MLGLIKQRPLRRFLIESGTLNVIATDEGMNRNIPQYLIMMSSKYFFKVKEKHL